MSWDSKPPTKEELEKADSWDEAAPSKEELAAIAPISPLESGLRGAAQGATFGFAPSIAGAASVAPMVGDVAMGGKSLTDLLNAYRKARDTSKEKFKKAEKENPKSYIAGNIAGAVLPAALTGGASEGASALEAGGALSAPVAEGIVNGAKIGALTGVGQSDADLTKGEFGKAAGDAIQSGILGGALGGAIGKASTYIPNVSQSLDQLGNERALKATGIGKVQLKNLIKNDINKNVYNATEGNDAVESSVQKMGKLLSEPNPYQESPVVSAGSTPEDILEKAQDLKAKSGKDIGNILDQFDQSYSSDNKNFVDPTKIANDIQTQLLDPLKVNGSIPPVSQGAAQTINNVLDTVKQYGNNPIPFEKAQELKSLINNITNYETPGSTNNQILRQVGGIINGNIEDAADAVTQSSGDKDLLNKYLKAKDLYKTANTTINASANKTAGNMVNRDFGLTDYLSGAAGIAAGGPVTGAASAIGNKLAKTYGNSVVSSVAKNTSNALSGMSNALVKAPKESIASLGQKMVGSGDGATASLGNILMKAADRDDIGRNALIFSLMQNPGYREILRKYGLDNTKEQ